MSGAAPNLFIVGAPKCGTTSLYHYLRSHPQIFFPSNQDALGRAKEPSHFCPELEITDRFAIRDRDEYLALYRDSEAATWRGDASTNYLVSTSAPGAIRSFAPDARIVIMLRPPVEFMRSYHSELVRHGHEDITDFHDAVAASPERARGLRIPPATGVPKCLDYFQMSRFSPQVARYLETFPRERVKIVLLEDMAAAPVETYRGILEFLGVDATKIPEFRVHNETPRHGPFERIVTSIYQNALVKRVSQTLFPYEARRRVVALLRRTDRGISGKDTRDEVLRKACAADVERLSALIGRDLSHWQAAAASD